MFLGLRIKSIRLLVIVSISILYLAGFTQKASSCPAGTQTVSEGCLDQDNVLWTAHLPCKTRENDIVIHLKTLHAADGHDYQCLDGQWYYTTSANAAPAASGNVTEQRIISLYKQSDSFKKQAEAAMAANNTALAAQYARESKKAEAEAGHLLMHYNMMRTNMGLDGWKVPE